MPVEVKVGRDGVYGGLDRCVGVQRSRDPVVGITEVVLRQDLEWLSAGPVDPDAHVVLVVVGCFRRGSDERHEVGDGALDGGGLDLPAPKGCVAAHGMPANRGCHGDRAVIVDTDPRFLPRRVLARRRVRGDRAPKSRSGVQPVHVFQWMGAAAPRIHQRKILGFRQHGSDSFTAQAISEARDAGVGDSGQPCSFVGVAAGGCLGEQRVQGLGRVATFLESRAVHGLDLPLLHPHRIRVVAHGRPEILVPVDEMWPLDTCGHLDNDGTVSPRPEAMDTQAEDRRGDSGDRRATQGTLVRLPKLAHVDASSRRLLGLAHTVDDQSTTAVRQRSHILGKICLRQPFCRREFALPVQIVRLHHTGGDRGIEELISHGARCHPEGTVKCCEAHAPSLGITHDIKAGPRQRCAETPASFPGTAVLSSRETAPLNASSSPQWPLRSPRNGPRLPAPVISRLPHRAPCAASPPKSAAGGPADAERPPHGPLQQFPIRPPRGRSPRPSTRLGNRLQPPIPRSCLRLLRSARLPFNGRVQFLPRHGRRWAA